MAAHMFGAWLVERSIVTAEAVVRALDRQNAGRIPLGRLAMTQGKLKVAQVFEILNRQAGSNRLFGELAIELGYLTPGELAELLLEQRRRGGARPRHAARRARAIQAA